MSGQTNWSACDTFMCYILVLNLQFITDEEDEEIYAEKTRRKRVETLMIRFLPKARCKVSVLAISFCQK